jgi:hypothetical protein
MECIKGYFVRRKLSEHGVTELGCRGESIDQPAMSLECLQYIMEGFRTYYPVYEIIEILDPTFVSLGFGKIVNNVTGEIIQLPHRMSELALTVPAVRTE